MFNKIDNSDYNECMGRGMCSVAPNISSFQEVMLILMRVTAYYVLKLEKLNYNCHLLKTEIIKGLANIISTTVYSDEQMLEIITCRYNDMIRVKREYAAACAKKNTVCKDIKLPLKFTPDMSMSDILKKGEHAVNEKSKKMNADEKYLAELVFVTAKSVSLSAVKLLDYDISDENAINQVINALHLFNFGTFPVKKAKQSLKILAKTDLQLWMKRKEVQFNTFGQVSETEVSFSTTPGKAVLVSGASLTDLKNFLDAADEVDVYTHGDLLIAHAFETFRKYKNLKGHFGTSSDNCVLDFATFPGPILMTKHANQNIEYLIRGRLFTTDDLAPKGVTRIENNNFKPVIEALKSSRGFSKGRKKHPVKICFNPENLDLEFDKIAQKLTSGVIKHLFIIGMSNFAVDQSGYFEDLLKNIPSDCFVISFSYHREMENLLYFNIANNFPLQIAVLDILFGKIPITSDNLTFYLTKCDANTLSSMIGLKDTGIKRLYLSSCPPTVLNPAIMNSFMQLYGINPLTTPENDLNMILDRYL